MKGYPNLRVPARSVRPRQLRMPPRLDAPPPTLRTPAAPHTLLPPCATQRKDKMSLSSRGDEKGQLQGKRPEDHQWGGNHRIRSP